MAGEHEEEEKRRQHKVEEALEVQSLRRIMSAYLNYPDAAEEDVRRYERSFDKLGTAHQALLPYYPSKFQKMRRCISANSRFICTMLQAFEPPLDMSLDVGVSPEKSFGKEIADSCSDGVISCCKTGGRVTGDTNCVSCRSQCSNLDSEGMTIQSQRVLSDGAELGSTNHGATPLVNCLGSPSHTEHPNGILRASPDWLHAFSQPTVPLVDVDKVRCIIRNIVRDWAEEGWKERDECYKPILEELDRLFSNRRHKTTPPTCLVPGAGLGRLALEISSLGFVCQGNEFSYYMMICSNFILNHTQIAGDWIIYPWIHSNCNSLSDRDQLRPVRVPDIHPASAGITDGFSMCGGDFVEVYSDQSQHGFWDAVVTCFFIDTAHNIIEYIEIIAKILKDGGIWINLGPLLYHFADMYGQQEEMSVELSLEDVKRVAIHYGFNVMGEATIETSYTTNPQSMMQNRYFAAFWTMVKDGSRGSV